MHKWNQSTRIEDFRVVWRHVVRHAEARMAYIPGYGCMITWGVQAHMATANNTTPLL